MKHSRGLTLSSADRNFRQGAPELGSKLRALNHLLKERQAVGRCYLRSAGSCWAQKVLVNLWCRMVHGLEGLWESKIVRSVLYFSGSQCSKGRVTEKQYLCFTGVCQQSCRRTSDELETDQSLLGKMIIFGKDDWLRYLQHSGIKTEIPKTSF